MLARQATTVSRTPLLRVAIGTLCTLGLATAASAGPPVLSADYGETARVWSSPTNPRTETLNFIWTPSQPVTGLDLLIAGRCSMIDEDGELVLAPSGNRQIVFKSVELTGETSGNGALASRQVERLRDGTQQNTALWNLTPLRELFTADSTVRVTGDVRVAKNVAAGHTLSCWIGIIELASDGAGGASTPPRSGAVARPMRDPGGEIGEFVRALRGRE